MKTVNYLTRNETNKAVVICFAFALILANTEVMGQQSPVEKKAGRIAGQISYSESSTNQDEQQNDTVPKIYLPGDRLPESKSGQPLFLLNGEIVDKNTLQSLRPEQIDSFNFEKEEIEIKGIKYVGYVKILLKADYKPQFISLNKLKSKYIESIKEPVIFTVDEKVIYANYDNYLVDEKYIMTIKVDNVNSKDNSVSIIQLLTRSKENLARQNEFWVR